MIINYEEKLLLVQFPHLGNEHKCNSTDQVKEWNTGNHTRKFIRAKGKYLLDLVSEEKNDDLMFWGEWECESLFEEIKYNSDRRIDYPKYIHKPIINVSNKAGLQNTDPYVFGENFIFSCCKQQSFKQLKNLKPGSIVVFGSKLNNNFVIDTVFVVKDGQDYNVNNIKSLNVSKTFYEATLKRIYIEDVIKLGIIDSEDSVEEEVYKGRNCVNKAEKCVDTNKAEFRLYKGVNYKEKHKFNGMFSFFSMQKI